MTIFLCTWSVYSGNTDKAPLVLQLYKTRAKTSEYFYLQKPIMNDNKFTYDYDIWYQNGSGGFVLIKHKGDKGKKWIKTVTSEMHDDEEDPAMYSFYDHPNLFPTEETNTETWNTRIDDNKEIVKLHIPAISNIHSIEEFEKYLDFNAKNTVTEKANITEYVRTKLQEKMMKQTVDFQSLCRKYSTINVLLKVTIKKEEFDQELLEFKTKWYYNEKVSLSSLYQQEVVRITKCFDTRIYWITGITILLIIIIICIIFCIIYPKQEETTDDMMNDEHDIYDEENPVPTSRLSNSEVSNSETECSITPVIFRKVSDTVSSQNIFSSEEIFDHPPTDENINSLQSEEEEEKVSNDIVTQQKTDTDSLFSSEENFNTDTNKNTDSLKSAEETKSKKTEQKKKKQSLPRKKSSNKKIK